MASDDSFVRRFRRKDELMLEHEFPHLFYTSQCRMPVGLYLLFRIFLVALTVHTVVLAFVIPGNKKFEIFFTNWTYVVQTVTMIYKLIIVSYYLGQEISSGDDGHRRTPVHLKVKWILHNISTIIPLVVTIVYWTMLFPEEKPKPTGWRVYINLEVHGLNSMAALLDFFISAVPFRLYHFLHPIAYGLIYVIFSVIYGLCGGTGVDGRDYIYFFFNWPDKPFLGISTCIGLLIFMILIHLILAYLKHVQNNRFGLCCGWCGQANQDARQRQTYGEPYPYVPSPSKRLADSGVGVWNKVGYINEATS